MIRGFLQSPKPEKGLSVYTKMLSLGIAPNNRTFTVLVKACVSLSLLDMVYVHVLKLGHVCDAFVTSSVISMYAKFGLMDKACVVSDANLNKNVACWTSLISGYCRNGFVSEAREVFDSMPDRNDVACSAMVSGVVVYNDLVGWMLLILLGQQNLAKGSKKTFSTWHAKEAVETPTHVHIQPYSSTLKAKRD
ncbi:hypothetical protein Pint_14108 [Pistacia integerrima]|uniref:Uncharacterized protein n=1 Tax=Pistacia integerrima TaxID=434235 RepID=A0ACC0Y687_9ROSI|nr:hypothetical protein Pint_14108 [Pistacia integerrima]